MMVFTKHAIEKFKLLRRHKFNLAKAQVIETVKHPDKIDYSRLPLLIAQRKIDRGHVLRVVYKQVGEEIKIITFYPGRASQYEKKS